MNADAVEVSWDPEKKKWLTRIQVGEEVIRRHLTVAEKARDSEILAAAEETAHDEGYEVTPGQIVFLGRPH